MHAKVDGELARERVRARLGASYSDELYRRVRVRAASPWARVLCQPHLPLFSCPLQLVLYSADRLEGAAGVPLCIYDELVWERAHFRPALRAG